MSAPTPLTSEQQELYTLLLEQLRSDGTRDQLKRHLKDRLLESGWQKELSAHCQAIIYERGLDKVTVDELVLATAQKATESVPNKVKNDFVEHLRETLMDRADQQAQ